MRQPNENVMYWTQRKHKYNIQRYTIAFVLHSSLLMLEAVFFHLLKFFGLPFNMNLILARIEHIRKDFTEQFESNTRNRNEQHHDVIHPGRTKDMIGHTDKEKHRTQLWSTNRSDLAVHKESKDNQADATKNNTIPRVRETIYKSSVLRMVCRRILTETRNEGGRPFTIDDRFRFVENIVREH